MLIESEPTSYGSVSYNLNVLYEIKKFSSRYVVE